ncbi:DUF5107 domain-containing protein [Arenibacter sp. ARW7G5Y1]|uniref:DUF5107 domain-containing protein n=1 Tax=Arenibacter sp. ARW7G5Y1 TaxID=2135619 RepID=UPI000D754F0C|nr:DUF5107 domain-containing protein [Arenibacter sp. ARW7G5Y1]PXX21827.1 Tfp pilus assembly protein PilF [Arenibacter sp. ARW7G5Y1]
MNIVKAWKEIVTIPTYQVGAPEKYPVFLEKRVYQGSSGSVYPNPVVEQISDIKTDKKWEAIFIENDYIKIMVLPALGGRIQMAYDKIRQRHFVYYNQVIKPALVGVTGPWVSGGIEFNWPQHHRPSTYDPTDYYIEENKDGSVTVWVSEVERMFRTKGMAGFTLYPNKAYLEVKGQLYNRTPHAQTFLWWANPALAVNDHYQSVFPPDVNAVYDHGKRDVSEFPIAKGVYYKVDYSPGTDISRYSTIPVPTSYMAITSQYDFVGGYENDTKGGLIHVADHHISPGKKQWTWGNGDFGRAWDRNLTDQDGPYIELMCGVYTDNQPDFSWMHPYEEKTFKQYFIPYYNVGMVKNATKEALINLELESGEATVKVYVTSVYHNCTIQLLNGQNVIFDEVVSLSPKDGFEKKVLLKNAVYENLIAILKDKDGAVLVSWSPEDYSHQEIPDPAKAAKDPNQVESVEQLFLIGLHLEQYRHATYDPTAYYLEALSREPGDVRNNNAMGLWNLKKGQFNKALPYFDRAIATLTKHNPNPYDGEPFFNKGLTLRFLGKIDEAYDAFFKSCWNAAWQDAGYFNLAQIDCAKGNLTKALELVNKALIKNWHNHKARHLKALLLRKLGRTEESGRLIKESLAIDPLNFGVYFEHYILTKESNYKASFKKSIRDNAHNYIEYSLDYAQVGQFEEAIHLLQVYMEEKEEVYPMALYFLGWYYEQRNENELAKQQYKLAQKMPSDYCFPSRLEEVVVLQAAIDMNPCDDMAPYYLGNFWYAARQYENARICWETSLKLNNNNPICLRNLALLYYNKEDKKTLAREYLERAFQLDSNNPRLLMELDQLYKKMNVPIDQRLELLENNSSLMVARDDLYLEKINILNLKSHYKKAFSKLKERQFHPWEGGEGKVPFQYITTHIELAKEALQSANYKVAKTLLESAQIYPHNLGEGKLFGAQENDIFYWLGCTYEKLGNNDKAKEYWEKASVGLNNPEPAIFYNDQQPDKIFYQGLALSKLNRQKEAQQRFKNLLDYGNKHQNDVVRLDYFAVSLPDLLIWEEDLNARNYIHCQYLIGLGELGLNHTENAISAFRRVIEKDRYHLSAVVHLKMAQKIGSKLADRKEV